MIVLIIVFIIAIVIFSIIVMAWETSYKELNEVAQFL